MFPEHPSPRLSPPPPPPPLFRPVTHICIRYIFHAPLSRQRKGLKGPGGYLSKTRFGSNFLFVGMIFHPTDSDFTYHPLPKTTSDSTWVVFWGFFILTRFDFNAAFPHISSIFQSTFSITSVPHCSSERANFASSFPPRVVWRRVEQFSIL